MRNADIGQVTPQESDMPAIKYRVTLSADEVEMLEALLHKGKSADSVEGGSRHLICLGKLL